MQLVASDNLGFQKFVVSILIRPFDRMQRPHPAIPSRAAWRFNPHPAFRPDATWPGCRSQPVPPRFNPHPAFRPDTTCRPAVPSRLCPLHFNPHLVERPDATDDGPADAVLGDGVSILIRSFGRMQRNREPIARQAIPVSILIRSKDRMQPVLGWCCPSRSPRFNPHPAFRPDATAVVIVPLRSVALVSILVRSFDRLRLNQHVFPDAARLVSILIQSKDWMQPPYAQTVMVSDALFQSSSQSKDWMQPCPRPRPRLPGPCFNPYPVFRPDATGYHGVFRRVHPVSILTRSFDRMQPSSARVGFTSIVFQSSSGRKTGCNPQPRRA